MSRSARSIAPASCSAATIVVVGRAGRRDVVAEAALVADEVLEHRGHARAPRVGIELAEVDAVDLDAALLRVVEPAEQLGERGLARAVHADDRHRRARGNREVEAVEHRRAGRAGTRTSRRGSGSRARACAVGRRRRRSLTASAPAAAIFGSSRLSATTGAAAPSSAQLQPPNAIIDVPTIAVRNTMVRSRLMRPSAAASAIDHATSTLAASTNDDAERRACVRAAGSTSTAARRGAGGGTMNRSITQSERPNRRSFLRRGRVDREPVRVLGVALRECAPRRCCGPATPRSRAGGSASRPTRR